MPHQEVDWMASTAHEMSQCLYTTHSVVYSLCLWACCVLHVFRSTGVVSLVTLCGRHLRVCAVALAKWGLGHPWGICGPPYSYP